MHEGLELGHKMGDVAADHAGKLWVEDALEVFKNHAQQHQTFTTEQVRAANPDLPEPPDRRAWGAIPRMAVKRGWVIADGWVRADSKSVHGMVVTQWRSKLFLDDRAQYILHSHEMF
jgi:hypothetical protein